jgi:hypothetical protein
VHTVSEKLGIEPDADQDSANYRKSDFQATTEGQIWDYHWLVGIGKASLPPGKASPAA